MVNLNCIFMLKLIINLDNKDQKNLYNKFYFILNLGIQT